MEASLSGASSEFLSRKARYFGFKPLFGVPFHSGLMSSTTTHRTPVRSPFNTLELVWGREILFELQEAMNSDGADLTFVFRALGTRLCLNSHLQSQTGRHTR